MEGYVDMPSQGAEDQWESEALGSSPSHLPSWSPVRRSPSGYPNTRYCLKIHVTLTKELGAVFPTSHSWIAPLMEYMLCDIRAGLTEAVVTGPGRAILLYGRCSLGEGLTMDKARDATFLLTGAGTWVGNQSTCHQSNDNSRRSTGNCPSHNGLPRGPGCPHVNPSTQQSFRFDHTRGSPLKKTPRVVDSNHRPLPHWPPKGQDCNRHRRDQRPPPPWLPSPSPDHQFESDRSLLSTTLLMSSRLDGSERS